MPANPKYLTHSKWQRFAKISAGFLGGYLVSASFFVMLAAWLERATTVATGSVLLFLVWCGLFIMAFYAQNGWKVWGLYLLLTVAFSALTYFGL